MANGLRMVPWAVLQQDTRLFVDLNMNTILPSFPLSFSLAVYTRVIIRRAALPRSLRRHARLQADTSPHVPYLFSFHT